MPDYSPNLLRLEILAGYVICLLVAAIGAAVVWKIWNGDIDLATLLNEKGSSKEGSPGVSMARFQLLVFVFVIALSFFLVVISSVKIVQARPGTQPASLPQVPQGVLLLLGISASGYAVGKAIQQGAGTEEEDGEPAKAKKDAHGG